MTICKWFVGGLMVLLVTAGVSEVSAQRPGGPRGPGGRPSFDLLLQAFDADGNGALEQGEVPGRVWSRLSKADANGNGSVSREEFEGYKP